MLTNLESLLLSFQLIFWKLDESIKSFELYISGNKFLRRDRNRNGEGAAFLYKIL